MRTLLRPILCIVILHCCILPIYASIQLGGGIGHAVHHIEVEHYEKVIKLVNKPLHATIETPLSEKTRIAFDVSFQSINEVWVSPLTTLRGYEAIGLGSRLVVPFINTNIASVSVGPVLGLWYARYANTPLAFAYAEAGVFAEGAIDIGNFIAHFSNDIHSTKANKVPLTLRLQVPYTIAVRKDISFQSAFIVRVGLLVGIS